MAYKVEFSRSALRHLQGFSAADRSLIVQAIESYLVYQPLAETRNRKFLRPNPLASWELRIGRLRVFYEVPSDELDQVHILAIGWKDGNRLFIDGEEIIL